MELCHPHNRSGADTGRFKAFGIRITLAHDDPFRRIVGDDWHKEHWYASDRERDAALADMSARHPYSRIGDEPRLIFQTIERTR